MSHLFHPSILREYDVRGIVGDTLSEADARALGKSYAALALSEGAKRVAVGRDGRLHSPSLEAALIDGLTASGLDVVQVGMGPSPMLYFAVATLGVDGGIQVTGSHNPADYNGFKMLLNGRSVYGEEIKALGRRAEVADWVEGAGEVTEADVIPAYIDALLKGFDGQAYRIGWDNGNGAGGEILDRLLKRLPGEHHTLYTDVDGIFSADPRLVPTARQLPTVSYEEMLELASVGAKVLQTRSVGLAMKEGVRVQVLSSFDDPDSAPARLFGSLADPDHTRILLVALPEATPVHEAQELQADVARAGLTPYTWVANSALSATTTTDPVLLARAAQESRWLTEIARTSPRFPAIVPWVPQVPVGVAGLRQLTV